MVKTVDLNEAFAGLAKLENRGPHTTEAEAQNSFMTIADYRDGGLFGAHFSGCSGWERHLKGDEIVHIVEGATLLEIIVDDVIERYDLVAGQLLVVPQGCWHRFTSENGVKVFTATPQPTEHLHVDDPRQAS